ncbi:hypothetical protein B0T16DRAFT_404028 [Cercophora newfieldiana]|uniref:Uncharacterized protein n=1 Tax=Cercophora newfieldiana TaxID=92897 RepID=A0AA40CU31_9PEZI|nr:hypothetical protein B0T16DRAFT_404028 [Cercophora newfieldiana]
MLAIHCFFCMHGRHLSVEMVKRARLLGRDVSSVVNSYKPKPPEAARGRQTRHYHRSATAKASRRGHRLCGRSVKRDLVWQVVAQTPPGVTGSGNRCGSRYHHFLMRLRWPPTCCVVCPDTASYRPSHRRMMSFEPLALVRPSLRNTTTVIIRGNSICGVDSIVTTISPATKTLYSVLPKAAYRAPASRGTVDSGKPYLRCAVPLGPGRAT